MSAVDSAWIRETVRRDFADLRRSVGLTDYAAIRARFDRDHERMQALSRASGAVVRRAAEDWS